MKMSKTTEKTEIKLSVSIQPGPTLQVQIVAWRRFWQRIMAEAKSMDTEEQERKERETGEKKSYD